MLRKFTRYNDGKKRYFLKFWTDYNLYQATRREKGEERENQENTPKGSPGESAQGKENVHLLSCGVGPGIYLESSKYLSFFFFKQHSTKLPAIMIY